MQNYDRDDPREKSKRLISANGRLNYNRSFDVNTLPKINGVPVISDMGLDDVGVRFATPDEIEKIIQGCWSKYGVFPAC